MKKITALLVLLVFALSIPALAQVKKTTTTKITAKSKPAPAAKKGGLVISPKVSYVGWFGIGAEFAPLYKITDDIDLMAEANWSFWSGGGGSGYVYGELNAVYNAQSFKMGEGRDAKTLDPYVGGGLIFGFPLGSAWYSGSFSGGLGFGVFGGVSTKFDPYIVYSQLKFASAPINLNYTDILGPHTLSWNALGLGMEFGVRLPL